MQVKAKKHLGQHFLTDQNIAKNIVDALVQAKTTPAVLEVGPGMGVLTKFLLAEPTCVTWAAEIDTESVSYLMANYPQISERLITESFLTLDFSKLDSNAINVIGNFPYNISSQIVFKIIDNFERVPLMVGMFQKEVAQRLAAPPGNKDYGILSVITQAYYVVEYLFTVHEHVFSPPPKVKSAVVRLTAKTELPACNMVLFKKVVKTAFNQRRKKLRNALSVFGASDEYLHPFDTKRAEELSVQDFCLLTNKIEQFINGGNTSK